MASEYDRLAVFCRRVGSLPALPRSALALVEAIDTGEASAIQLERIISGDPSLTWAMLRYQASNDDGDVAAQRATIRNIIMRMGQTAVRAVAMSLAMKDFSRSAGDMTEEDFVALNQHSLAVGSLARYTFLRINMLKPFKSRWTADEMYAAGVFHDIGIPLVAKIAPEVYSRVNVFARRSGITFDEAFSILHEGHVNQLASIAAASWNVPSIFQLTLNHYHTPYSFEEEYVALSCLNYANYLAISFGYMPGSWPVEAALAPDVAQEVALPEEELEPLRSALETQLGQILNIESSRQAA